MAKVGPRRSFPQRFADLEEQVRLLRLRTSGGVEPVEPWQSLAPYLGENWLTSGTLGQDWFHARFYRDRERVYFAGNIELQVDGNWAPFNQLPSGYAPERMTNQVFPVEYENSSSSVPAGTWWIVEILPLPPGSEIDQRATSFGANGYPLAFTTFFLDGISYRIS